MKYFLIISFTIFYNLNTYSQDLKNWTIMHYSAGSNSSETDLLSDFDEMKRGKISMDYNLITLIDRVEGFSNDSMTLDGNFTDTRLYKINYNSYERLEGKEYFPEMKFNQSYEANMGDALVLKNFIKYCKKYFPANNYMLVMRSHGNGVAMCPDAEGGPRDHIYPAEMSNILTGVESIDILGLDVCSMAGLENLYEWRPGNNSFSADYVLASSPLSGAWAYDAILNRLTASTPSNSEDQFNYFNGGLERNLDPKTMTPFEFSKLIIEEIYDQQRWSSWGLFDNSKIEDVKSRIDEASKLLSLEDKKLIINIIHNTLGYYHHTSDNLEVALLTSPYVDAYHFWAQISKYENFNKATRDMAREVCAAIDELVIDSYYGQGYLPETRDFEEGKGGVYQIIPRGDKLFSQTKRSFWSHTGWFHPDNKSGDDNSYGQYGWCINGAIRSNNKVDNFFELLDFLFDSTNNHAGGVNNYQW